MIKNNKNAQGMPINVIIIAALALVVFIILLMVFSGKVRIFSENLQSCVAKQGTCDNGPVCASNKAIVPNTDCDKEDRICCVTVFEMNDGRI